MGFFGDSLYLDRNGDNLISSDRGHLEVTGQEQVIDAYDKPGNIMVNHCLGLFVRNVAVQMSALTGTGQLPLVSGADYNGPVVAYPSYPFVQLIPSIPRRLMKCNFYFPIVTSMSHQNNLEHLLDLCERDSTDYSNVASGTFAVFTPLESVVVGRLSYGREFSKKKLIYAQSLLVIPR